MTPHNQDRLTDLVDLDAISIPVDRLPVPPAPPRVDDENRVLLDRLIDALVDLRFPLSRHDATARLHVLASLAADVHARIPDLIADARDPDYTWAQIATSLATSPAAARRRHRDHAGPAGTEAGYLDHWPKPSGVARPDTTTSRA